MILWLLWILWILCGYELSTGMLSILVPAGGIGLGGGQKGGMGYMSHSHIVTQANAYMPAYLLHGAESAHLHTSSLLQTVTFSPYLLSPM